MRRVLISKTGSSNLTPGLTITIVDPYDDYAGIEIQARNDRFAGSARVCAGLDELTEFACHLVGFPKNHSDQKSHEFGSRETGNAGGYCRIQFHCLDRAGHIAIHVELEEEDVVGRPSSSAKLTLQVEAAEIDRFIETLRALDRERWGRAVLASV